MRFYGWLMVWCSLAAAKELFFTRGYPDYQTMLREEAALPDNGRIDYVTIVTPNDSHYPIAKAALEKAKAKGVKFTISTDAHHPKHLANMRYGVVTARRGWLEAGDVMNTLGAAAFAEAIQAKS